MNEGLDVIVCAYCGRLIRNTPTANISYAQVPYPHDDGYGYCRECGGDPTVPTDDHSIAALKKRLGSMAISFYEARFEVLRQALSPSNAAKFEAMSYAKKIALVTRLVEQGTMI